VPWVSITRLRLRGYRYVPSFLWQAQLSSEQARSSPGFLAGAIFASPLHRTFWTLTVWKEEAEMRAFRGAGDHRNVMTRLADWCDEAAVAHWQQRDAAAPSNEDMLHRMQSSGRVSRVNHPTPGHAEGKTVPDGRAPRRGVTLKPGA
jgi:hypothetical protein